MAWRRAVTWKWLVVGLGVALSAAAGSSSVDSAILGPTMGTQARNARAPMERQGPFAVVLVVDAARFDQFNLDRMPNLAKLVASGTTYTNAWVGQLPSVTETSHATIGTGMLPLHHLVLGDTWRVPGKNQMSPNLLNGALDRTGYIGKFIQQKGVPTVASLVHQRYPGSLVVSVSGHKVYAADAMGAAAADFVSFGGKDGRLHFVPEAIPGHAPSQNILSSPQLDLPSYPRQPGTEDGWTATLAEKFLFKYHPRVLMVNFPEVDVTGHIRGTDATFMQPLFSNIDHQIGRLVAAYGRAGLLSQTYWIVTSDHAMIPGTHTVTQSRVQDVVKAAGGKILYAGHGDYCPVWLQNIAAVPRVATMLANANLPGVAAVYAKNISGAYSLISAASRLATPTVNQAYQDLLSTFDSSESPDIVLMYDENTITMTPAYLKIGRKGDHGGATWGAQHIPLVLVGPNVKQAYVSQYPARLVDIAPTLETLLGIRPQGQDGIPLADAMLKPPTWAVAAQFRVEPRMTEDVTALEREAAQRPNTHK